MMHFKRWGKTGLLFLILAPGLALSAEIPVSRCQILQDSQGIPHARGRTEAEGIACLGYLHGRDRAWQMDHLRRIVLGTRAEVYGSSLVKGDFTMRLLGLAERAEKLFRKMSPKDQEYWIAYSIGVNRGFKEALSRGVYEFKELGYEPSKWEPWHSIAVFLLQAFDQTKKNFETQRDEKEWLKEFGKDSPWLFSQEGLPWDVTILKEGEYPQGHSGPSAKESLSGAEASSTGSNNWVLAPARSQSGHAWLANDPHLALKSPPFWYWAQISAGSLDVIGASVPGVPVIASGTNQFVSWGLTNSYLDVAEQAQVPENDLKAVESVRPTIWFKFGPFKLPFIFKSFRRTPGGLPVLPLPADSGKAQVLWWDGFDVEPSDLKGFFKIMKARSAREMDQAFSELHVPSWNYVFADTHGQIGYRAVGRVPKWEKPKTYGISEKSVSELEAPRKELSAEEMPHVLAPKRGYVATANNLQWPANGAFYIGRSHSPAFRAFRIEELLTATPKHDLESQRMIQCDLQAVDARFLLPLMLKAAGNEKGKFSKRALRAIENLREWDFWTGEDCRVCAIYRRWAERLGAGIDENALYRFLSGKLPKEIREKFKKRISARKALEEALDDLEISEKGDLPKWGELHEAPFPHLAGPSLFRAPALPTPGDKHSVNPGTADFVKGHYEQTSGASQRLLVEMSSPPRVYSVLAGENLDIESRDLKKPESGWQKWVSCELTKRIFPMDWSRVHPEVVDLH